ncbi:MAG: ComEC/Rec2 family competence protein [Deltaproteobacteria bacterium]|nr:ComEC/Rec2 family competence protein [Deltaproteobacteria bacterium]
MLKGLHIPPLLAGWLAALLGVYAFLRPSLFPSGFWLLIGAFLLFLFSRYRLLIVLFFSLAFVRSSLPLSEVAVAPTFEIPQKFKLKVIEKISYGALAEILEGPLKSKIVKLPADGACSAGCELEGVAQLFPLSRISRDRNLIAQLKWADEPSRILKSSDLRQIIRSKIFNILQTEREPLHGFRRALVLGDGKGIPAPAWEAMNYLGLSHLMVISGSHLSFLILCLLFFNKKIFQFFRLKKFIFSRALLLILISIFYVLTNFDISLSRAWLTCLATLGMSLFVPSLHRYRRTEILAAVGLVLLFWDPHSVTSTTYLLSFAATFALLISEFWGDRFLLNQNLFCKLFIYLFLPYFILSPLCYSLGLFIHPLSPLFNFIFLPIFGFVLVPASLGSIFIPSLEKWANQLLHFYFDGLRFFAKFLETITPRIHLPTSYAIPFLFLIIIICLEKERSFKIRSIFFLIISLVFIGSTWMPWEKFLTKTRQGVEYRAIHLDRYSSVILLKMEDQNILLSSGSTKYWKSRILPHLLSDFRNSTDLWISFNTSSKSPEYFKNILNWIDVRAIWTPAQKFKSRLGTCSPRFCLELDTRSRGPGQFLIRQRLDGSILEVFSKDLSAKKTYFLFK